MPFTTSHPAIILPLKKFWPSYFSLTGLIAGAMAPDLIYFITLTTIDRGFTHSWSGLIWFCLPVGLLFSLAVHKLVKYPLISNLPQSYQIKLSGLAALEWGPKDLKSWMVLISSVLVGTLSHYFLDSFTHEGGQSVRLLPFLAESVSFGGRQIHIYRILQHLFSFAGGLTMIIYFLTPSSLPTPVKLSPSKSKSEKIKFWLFGILFAVCFALLILMSYKRFFPQFVVREFTTFGLAGFAGFFYYCAIVSIIIKKVHPKQI